MTPNTSFERTVVARHNPPSFFRGARMTVRRSFHRATLLGWVVALVFALCAPLVAAAQTQEVGTSVFDKAAPAVVVIRAKGPAAELQGSGVAFRYGFKNRVPASTWVATNAHVVQNATSVIVQVGESQYAAAVEYSDADLDLALLWIDGFVIPRLIQLAGVAKVQVGSRVFAIGSPLGLRNSITDGLVSGFRDRKGVRLLQTSAAISKGNSGGGLFDGEGRLLGITTFKLQGGENLNFAVDAQHLLAVDKALLSANLIRAGYERKVVRPGDDNDLDERFIESPALTKWLLDREAVDGSPLYEYGKRLAAPP